MMSGIAASRWTGLSTGMKVPRIAAAFVMGVRLFAAEPRLVAPGTMVKSERNPLLHADQPWENVLNNLYPNVLWDAEERVFKMWYKCVLADKEVIAKMDGPSTVHDVGWYLLYAASQDGVAFIPRGPKGTYDSECIYAMSGPAIAQVKCAFP